MGWEWFHPTTPYSDYWREGRKLLDRNLRASAVVQYRPMQLAKTHDLLYQLLTDSTSFHDQIELCVYNLLGLGCPAPTGTDVIRGGGDLSSGIKQSC
jgi:hypothetical protein